MINYKIKDDFSNPEPLSTLLARLPEWRRQKALAYKQEQGQRECAEAYLLLEQMLGWQPEFSIAEHGKPYTPPVYFNLSHCKVAVACVVSDRECGIDVERIGRYNERLARYCMSDDEMQQILSAESPDATFTELWTRKEALLKLTGEGITDDMKSCLTSERMHGVTMQSGINKEKGYAYAVAVRDNI